jgi:hypothetical protein
MLKEAKAFSGLAVDDVPRARELYATTLGLDVADAPWAWTAPTCQPVWRSASFQDPAGNILSLVEGQGAVVLS